MIFLDFLTLIFVSDLAWQLVLVSLQLKRLLVTAKTQLKTTLAVSLKLPSTMPLETLKTLPLKLPWEASKTLPLAPLPTVLKAWPSLLASAQAQEQVISSFSAVLVASEIDVAQVSLPAAALA